jgi:hypothetical protein
MITSGSASSSMPLGDRDRLLGLLASNGNGALAGLQRQVAEAGDLHPRAPEAAPQRDRLLEVPAGVLDARRPQLRDAERAAQVHAPGARCGPGPGAV